MSKSWDDCNRNICCKRKDVCRIQINNILVCSGKHKKIIDEYDIDKDVIKSIRDNKDYKYDKKGVTIVNKLNCKKCCDNDDDDDDD